jgi:hypothetical protein
MKRLSLILATMALLIVSCTGSYIDDIEPVSPGEDTAPPEVMINFPNEGTQIRVAEETTTLNIEFEVSDDIEIESITLILNGETIRVYDDFLDYRRFVGEHRHENLGNGEHTLTIEARDLSGKTTTESVTFEKVAPYTPIFEGETFYLPFDGDFMELVSAQNATVEGSPGFVEGIVGRAYRGANNAYLTYPTEGLLHDEFTAVFWLRPSGDPDRAGILVIGPPDEDNPENQNNRTSGFRLFREAAGPMQRIKLNIGNGEEDNWFDGGDAADVTPGEWAHVAITITQTNAAVYINGEVVSEGEFPGIDWTGTDIVSVASGAPRFTEWGHLSETGNLDELRMFNRELTQAEIQAIIATERP